MSRLMLETFFGQPINNNIKTYGNISIIATGQGDDYTTSCLSDYSFFAESYKMIAVDLNKKQALEGDPRTIKKTNFNGNLDCAGGTAIFFNFEEAKETILDFSQETIRVL